MAVIKQACPKCGQRVSGDESFYGTSVECPICSSKIFFPDPRPPKLDKEQEPETSEDRSSDDSRLPADDVEKKDHSPPARSSSAAERTPQPAASPQYSVPPSTYAEPPSPALSIISMVLGILNAVTFCIPSIVLAPAAIICGHIALVKGKFSPVQPAPGRSMAITGLVLGYLGMVVLLVMLGLTVTNVFNVFAWFRGHFEAGGN